MKSSCRMTVMTAPQFLSEYNRASDYGRSGGSRNSG
jgi:hypothetical protein